jgi:hypothetical protein
VSGERDTLRALLHYQRESFVRKLTGVDEGEARRVFVPSGASLLWLAKHMARAESLWIEERFAGGHPSVPDDTIRPDDTVAEAISVYRATWFRVDRIVADADFEESCRQVGNEAPVNLRWVVMHLLEETARHAGHVDILRELIDGSTGR